MDNGDLERRTVVKLGMYEAGVNESDEDSQSLRRELDIKMMSSGIRGITMWFAMKE